MEANRALQPIRSLSAACPTSVRLIAAIPGSINELAKPCIAKCGPGGDRAEQAAHRGDGQRQSYRLWRPVVFYQIDCLKDAEAGLHSGNEEVEPVEAATATCHLGGAAMLSPNRRPGPAVDIQCGAFLHAIGRSSNTNAHRRSVRNRYSHHSVRNADLHRPPTPAHCEAHAGPFRRQARSQTDSVSAQVETGEAEDRRLPLDVTEPTHPGRAATDRPRGACAQKTVAERKAGFNGA